MRFNPDEYITVHERIEKFYAKWPNGRILTSLVEHSAETGFILMRAEVYREPDDALPAATGHAYELRSAGHVQQGSYVEVCETSAVGRALALLGFETRRNGAGEAQARPASKSPLARDDATPPSRADGDLKPLLKRISELSLKLTDEKRATQPELDRMLRAHGVTLVAELPLAKARLHLAELSELFNSRKPGDAGRR